MQIVRFKKGQAFVECCAKKIPAKHKAVESCSGCGRTFQMIDESATDDVIAQKEVQLVQGMRIRVPLGAY